MAKLFISYLNADEAVAQRLERQLVQLGHRMAIPVGAAVEGNWRTKYTKALVSADVFIVVLSADSLSSNNVAGEIGAARAMEATRGMLMLPVLVGDMPIPQYLNDIFCRRLKDTSDQEVTSRAQEMHRAIEDNIKLGPRIFISHRHVDEPIAASLVALLEQAFVIERNDIRCTSVKPYTLTPGERTSEQLRSEISRAELVIGILTPETSESNYVLCELGASWGRGVTTFPVLARGATFADVPSPLNERHSMSLESESNCLDLIEYVASKTSMKRQDTMLGKLGQQATRLAVVSASQSASGV